MRLTLAAAVIVGLGCASSAAAQVPQPFPKPGQPASQAPPKAAPGTQAAPPQDASEPLPGSLGVPVPESAQFITSYNAGRG